MPQDEHPGFEFWDPGDINHPFPVGEIVFGSSAPEGGSASATFIVPPALPGPSVVAERSIGMARSCKLWFALRCTRGAGGAIACEAVLRGQHLNFFPEHGEEEVGPLQEIRLGAAEMAVGGFQQRVAGHGDHCDSFSATWGGWQGQFSYTLSTWHFGLSPEEFLRVQEKAKKEAYYTPPKPRGWMPEIRLTPLPEEEPVPAPEPLPDPDAS